MNKKQPINFVNNHFIYQGGNREYFKGEKEYVCLPSKLKQKVSNFNIWTAVKEVYIPISQLSANINSYQFCNTLCLSDIIGFYDIETSDKEEFILGYVNNEKFTDAKLMVQRMKNFDVLVSFNGMRFDNEILFRYAPEYFIEVKNADFIARTLQGVVMLDLMSLIRIDISRESYSAEAIAQELGFNEKIINHEDDNKDRKCLQDIEINRFIFEKINAIKLFNTISTLVNCDTTLWQIVQGDRLRKWILINHYLNNGILPLKVTESKEIKLQDKPYHYAKKGFYENYKYLDITSAYSQTSVNLHEKGIKLGIYGKEDNNFGLFQKYLLELCHDQEIKTFIKGIGNSLIGSQFSKNEYWKNEDIFNSIVTYVSQKVQKVKNSREDIIYINTDCFVVPQDSEDIKIEGYNLKEQYNFTELYIFNENKWIGKSDGIVHSRGFRRLNSRTPGILKVARDEILSRLTREKGEDFNIALNTGEKLVSKTIKKLKKYNNDMFKITIRKSKEICEDISLINIWNSLPRGFSQLYYKENGDLTIDSSKIGLHCYKSLIISLAEEYSTEVLN